MTAEGPHTNTNSGLKVWKYDPDKLILPRSHCSLSPGSWADNLLKSNPEPSHDIGLMNYHQLSYGPGLSNILEQQLLGTIDMMTQSLLILWDTKHCMLRGVKTSTWSPQLLFVSDTHNNLLSIPTSTNHTLQRNVFWTWVWYLQGKRQ